MKKRYVSMYYPSLSMTARVNDSIVRIKFENGVFETEDPNLQAAVEGNLHFGSQIWEAGAESPKPKKKAPENAGTQSPWPHDPLQAALRDIQAKEAEEAKNAQKDGRKAKKASKKKRV